MPKFIRNYELRVQANDGTFVVVTTPFTIEFDVVRKLLGSANVSTIRVMNLKEATRNLILKDQFAYNDIRTVILKAGYGKELYTVFHGNVTRCFSVRQGTTFVTQIEAFDGGDAYNNSFTSIPVVANTPNRSVISRLFDDLEKKGVKPGKIGSYGGNTLKGNSYDGRTVDILGEILGGPSGGFFIDNMTANALKTNEVLPDDEADTLIVSASSGLIGTPLREQQYLNFDIIFEPRLKIGQRIRLDSITGANFNMYYKVQGIHHKGTISDAVCGNLLTSISVFYGIGQLTQVQ